MKSCPDCGEKLDKGRSCAACGWEPFDPSRRVLCSDETCTGIINNQGLCGTCHKPYMGELDRAALGGEEAEEEEGLEEEAPEEEPSPEVEFDPDDRIPCSDGLCTGIINAQGVCGTCGKAYDPSA